MDAYDRAALAADARDPASSLRPRRVPATEAGAGEQCAARREKFAIGDMRSPPNPAGLVDSGEKCGVRRENDATRDTRPPANPAALVDSGEQRGVRRENDATGDSRPSLNPASELNSGQPCCFRDTEPPQTSTSSHASKQVPPSDAGSEISTIDPELVYKLYMNHDLDALLAYLGEIPGAARDFNCKAIIELVNISISGYIPEDVPEDVQIEWHCTRAEYARNMARKCSFSQESSSSQHLIVTSTPIEASSSTLNGYSSGSCEPALNMIIPRTDNEGQKVQSIPLGSRYWDTHRSLLPNVEGLSPLRFYGPHPVWEEHAAPLEKDKNGKVKAFYCMYCKRGFSGNASTAEKHLNGGTCKIPPDAAITLMDKLDERSARISEKLSNAKGKKERRSENVVLKRVQKCTASKILNLVMGLYRDGDETGDGISEVLMMSRSLLNQTEVHLRNGIDSIKILQGFEMACKKAFDHLQSISQKFKFSPVERKPLERSCMAALSAIDSNCKKSLAQIAVEAVLSVSDMESIGVNLDCIKVQGKVGGKADSTELVHGIIIEKEMSHLQMRKKIDGAKIAFVACLVEPSKTLHEQKKAYLSEMVKTCQSVGATLVLCEWNFDDEVSDLLMQNNLPAVRGVSSAELESIAIATGGQIVSSFQGLTHDKLGKAELVREKKFGRSKLRMIYIEKCVNRRIVTILLHGGTKKIIDDTKKSLADALCVVKNLILKNCVVCGAGSAEISCSIAVEAAADGYSEAEQTIIRSFAYVLDTIPLSLAENSGLPPIETLARLKSRHIKENRPHFGVDCNAVGNDDMQVQQVFASLVSKVHQISLALKVLKMILNGVT